MSCAIYVSVQGVAHLHDLNEISGIYFKIFIHNHVEYVINVLYNNGINVFQ